MNIYNTYDNLLLIEMKRKFLSKEIIIFKRICFKYEYLFLIRDLDPRKEVQIENVNRIVDACNQLKLAKTISGINGRQNHPSGDENSRNVRLCLNCLKYQSDRVTWIINLACQPITDCVIVSRVAEQFFSRWNATRLNGGN